MPREGRGLTAHDRAEIEKFREFLGRVGPISENPTPDQARVYFEMYEPNVLAELRSDSAAPADSPRGPGAER